MKNSALGSTVALLVLAIAAPQRAGAQEVLLDEPFLLGIDDVEITPDGRYAVARENSLTHTARIYDLATGTLAATVTSPTAQGTSGVSQDTVAVTDDRAVVIGSSVDVIDLTNLANPLLASHPAGTFVRDVALTPDGTIAAVRGGSGPNGGLFLYDLATGAEIAAHPGQPSNYFDSAYSFDVDGVVVNDRYAVMCSLVGTLQSPRCRVALFLLHPPGGGPPIVAFETADFDESDLIGAPHDLTLTPDGRRVVVRSELELAVYDVRSDVPAVLLRAAPQGVPEGFEDEALDSVEATDDRVVTISRYTNQTIGVGTQIDVFNLEHLSQGSVRVVGSPHDLAITPDATRAVVRTSAAVHLVDLRTGVTGPGLILDSAQAPGTSVAYFAGFDSVVVTDDRAVTITRGPVGTETQIRFWDISGGGLDPIAVRTLANSQPIDVAITPDESKAVLVGTSKVAVYLLETGTALLDHAVVGTNAWYPWNDGVAVDDERAVAVGYWWAQSGWLSIVDIAPLGTSFCQTAPNSAGPGARIGAVGTLAVSANDLGLWVQGAPPEVVGGFFYGATQAQTPFGDGTLCVGGTTFALGGLTTNAVGAVSEAVDLTSPPDPAGLITPGSTWYFQLAYRDLGFGAAGFNLSDGIGLSFGP